MGFDDSFNVVLDNLEDLERELSDDGNYNDYFKEHDSEFKKLKAHIANAWDIMADARAEFK